MTPRARGVPETNGAPQDRQRKRAEHGFQQPAKQEASGHRHERREHAGRDDANDGHLDVLGKQTLEIACPESHLDDDNQDQHGCQNGHRDHNQGQREPAIMCQQVCGRDQDSPDRRADALEAASQLIEHRFDEPRQLAQRVAQLNELIGNQYQAGNDYQNGDSCLEQDVEGPHAGFLYLTLTTGVAVRESEKNDGTGSLDLTNVVLLAPTLDNHIDQSERRRCSSAGVD